MTSGFYVIYEKINSLQHPIKMTAAKSQN